METYVANKNRYKKMKYNHVGDSGLKLPAISLGMWQNFGTDRPFHLLEDICKEAFDLGITHFDLANNYGNIPGAAEETFGKILTKDFSNYRDEIVISTKAGYDMWDGPYGDGGSRKYIIRSCEQSLKRLGTDYIDIFYNHRRDSTTPLYETALALDHLFKTGKVLYVGVSNYSPEDTKQISQIFKKLNTPFIVHQPQYNMFNRTIEEGLEEVLNEEGLGAVVFSPLAQGLLTDRYLNGFPEDSRAMKYGDWVTDPDIAKKIEIAGYLNEIAQKRGQTLAEMAIAWNLRRVTIASVLIGVSRVEQLIDNVKALDHLDFSEEELQKIDLILSGEFVLL